MYHRPILIRLEDLLRTLTMDMSCESGSDRQLRALLEPIPRSQVPLSAAFYATNWTDAVRVPKRMQRDDIKLRHMISLDRIRQIYADGTSITCLCTNRRRLRFFRCQLLPDESMVKETGQNSSNSENETARRVLVSRSMRTVLDFPSICERHMLELSVSLVRPQEASGVLELLDSDAGTMKELQRLLPNAKLVRSNELTDGDPIYVFERDDIGVSCLTSSLDKPKRA